LIEVKNLVKRYGNYLAVDNLSFTVEKGEIVGLLGPNGAGKSTTMNVMTGYLSATEGSVSIDGYDIFDEPEEAKKLIGYLPEQPPVYMDMTVTEYLEFVAALKSVPKKQRKSQIDEIMEDTKLTHMKNRLIRHLSKGYRQRVGIAGALIGYPELIILDEPTVGLDPKQITEIRDLIKKLSQKHTVILSSHILSEVSAVCQRILIINKGKLIVDDTPDKLEEQANANPGLKVSVKGSLDRVNEVLKRNPDITSITETKEVDGISSMVLYTKDNKDIREELFYQLAEEKLPLYEYKLRKLSLEDIFLELTTDHTPMEEDEEVNVSPEDAVTDEEMMKKEEE
jgi:ABC-type multidrug transport system, ATPase component